ncbi:hypothetical protein EV356DRAFT_280915 [Viridothelium virens]|uniref:Uncharacterized protein n=1 Tax=Viridothelium virens TaxID=1048519 RepID=A0A6A6H1V1_VIRVR|nr:hypothetical protein EV356DRAFT_280915 [Viridothelium virens]
MVISFVQASSFTLPLCCGVTCSLTIFLFVSKRSPPLTPDCRQGQKLNKSKASAKLARHSSTLRPIPTIPYWLPCAKLKVAHRFSLYRSVKDIVNFSVSPPHKSSSSGTVRDSNFRKTLLMDVGRLANTIKEDALVKTRASLDATRLRIGTTIHRSTVDDSTALIAISHFLICDIQKQRLHPFHFTSQ